MALLPPAPSRRFLDLVLAAAVVVLYGDAIAYGYIWDDHRLSYLGLGDAFEHSFAGVHVRPVWYVSHVLSSALRSPVVDHVVNLLLFILAAALAWRVATLFLGRSNKAFLVALTWVFLPWNAFPAVWVAQRSDLLIFVFAFTALLALHRGRHLAALALLTLAVFSKPTVAFLPLFFLWKWRERRPALAAACGLLLAAYWTLALRGYLLYFEPAEHLSALPAGLRLLIFPLHWAEHFATLAVPLPFFVSGPHAGLYLAAMVGLLATGLRHPRTAQGSEAPSGRDVLALALLASIPKAVTPELRICGLESLFWLILIASRLRFDRKPLAAACYLALMASYGTGLVATKAVFDARFDLVGAPERALYPNGYYSQRRELLVGLARRWRLLRPPSGRPAP